MEPVYRADRARPICYRFRHPLGGRPLVVLGHYEVTSGGCDTIGSLDEVFQRAADAAAGGHDVLFEGLQVSAESDRSAALAAAHGLHVLHLDTPLDRCVRNLVARRRARRDARPLITRIAAVRHAEIEEACARLRQCHGARVDVLGFDEALRQARALLGVERIAAAA